MDPKLLTENAWKATAAKFKVKDNGLQRALAIYERLGEDKHDEQLKALAAVNDRANALKKDKVAAANAEVGKYLTNVLAAAKVAQADVAKAQSAAAMTAKKAELEARKQELQKSAAPADEEEEDEGDSFAKLTNALQSLKTSKLPYFFLYCKEKPYGLVVSKRDISKSAQHKKELAKVAGGSTTPPRYGQCRREGNQLIFEMEKPVPGMARILQKWIKENTGLGLKVMVGDESADDEASETARDAAAPLPALSPALAKAPASWRQARRDIAGRIDQLKAAVRKEFAEEAPDILSEVEANMAKLDRVLDAFDDKLADAVDKAQAADSAAARQGLLQQAKAIVATHIKYVRSEPLIAHIDSNPFGVKTNLKQTLTATLTEMAKAVS